MKNLLLVVFIIVGLVSCSEQRRCARFIEKHPICFQETIDTIVKYDTIVGVKYDTIFKGVNIVDTFLVDSGGIKVKTIVRWKTKEILQNVIQKDTIVKHLYVEKKNKPIIIEKTPSWVDGIMIGGGLFIVLLLLVLYIVFNKFRKSI